MQHGGAGCGVDSLKDSFKWHERTGHNARAIHEALCATEPVASFGKSTRLGLHDIGTNHNHSISHPGKPMLLVTTRC